MKVVCIVQARLNSKRLPDEVLKKICGKTILEHVINRLRRVKNIDEIVIATTILEKDNAIVEECKRLRVKYFRGLEDDVLSRYYYVAKENNSNIVVRITSDCPLIDSDITENIIRYFIDNIEKYDYVSNTIDRTYPRGLDTEVFSFSSLEKAFKEATSKSDKEHVTPYIWNKPEIFRIMQYKNSNDYSNLRWTLDTNQDFELISKIYEHFEDNTYFGMNEILKFFKENPNLKYINKDVKQKLIYNQLFLVKANLSHCNLLYEWVNDDEVRKNSFRSSKITYEEHVKWYLRKLKDPNCNIYLLVNNNENIGIVRIEEKENIISYSIAKEYRGNGYGYIILSKIEEELMKKGEDILFTAYVKKENISSIRIFEKLNYKLVEEIDDRLKFEKNIKKERV